MTIFIGGNHEASNYLQELPYGGWVAPNIYYLGYAGVVKYRGIRIGGLSGIYKGFDYYKGHFEYPPYNENTKRSVYHYRQQEIFRLKQISQKIDIVLSHDWPRGVTRHGNEQQLCRFKPHFTNEIKANCLGSPPCMELLEQLKPTYWFSGHLHCKFAAIVPHNDQTCTKFLALDKCLPNRRFLQLVDVNVDENASNELEYDLEWLTILYLTKHLTSVKPFSNYMPGPDDSNVRWNFLPSEQEKEFVLKRFADNLKIPTNFEATAAAYNPNNAIASPFQPKPTLNPQTTRFCELLDIDDPLSMVLALDGAAFNDQSFTDNLNETGDQLDGNDADKQGDSDNNETFNELNNSVVSTTVQTGGITPIKKRLSLLNTLPLPKYGQVEAFDDIDNPVKQTEQPDSNCTSFVDDSSSEQNLETIDGILNVEKLSNEKILEDANQSPASKKFIRRNASIYNAENDD